MCVRIRVHVCARVYYIYILYLLYKIYIILILDLKDLEYIILRILKTRTRQARASCERTCVSVYARACAQARTRDNSIQNFLKDFIDKIVFLVRFQINQIEYESYVKKYRQPR